MQADLSQFKLSKAQLFEVRKLFIEGAGLGNYPSCIYFNNKPKPGEYIAIELGGSNLRAGRVTLSSSNPVIGKIISGNVPCTKDTCSPKEFYNQIIDQIEPVLDNILIGFTFSFATLINEAADGKLLYWTKGIKVPKLVGKYIGAEFIKILHSRGYRVPRIVLLNDTVATFLSGINHDPVAGLVVGTGMNLAVVGEDQQVINCEAGNLKVKDLSVWTEIDEELDKISPEPGINSFEKLVSGKYLPLIYNKITNEKIANSKQLAMKMLKGDKLAKLLFTRSAQLIGAILSTTLEMNPQGQTLQVQNKIITEGAIFWEVPGYKDIVSSTVLNLSGQSINFIKIDNPGLVGAAIAVGLTDSPNT